MNQFFATSKMRGCLSRLDERFKSYDHLKLLEITKNVKTLNGEIISKLSRNMEQMTNSGGYAEFQEKNLISKMLNHFSTNFNGR